MIAARYPVWAIDARALAQWDLRGDREGRWLAEACRCLPSGLRYRTVQRWLAQLAFLDCDKIGAEVLVLLMVRYLPVHRFLNRN